MSESNVEDFKNFRISSKNHHRIDTHHLAQHYGGVPVQINLHNYLISKNDQEVGTTETHSWLCQEYQSLHFLGHYTFRKGADNEF
jgi:hypothetical protein